MSFKIGSFNVRNLSWGSGAKRDLDMIASLIKEFDIIALQEVLSEGKILEGPTLNEPSGQAKAYEHSLRSRLGDNWEMCWLDPQTNSKWYPYIGDDKRGEGYAFLWKKDKFKLPVNEYGRRITPRIYRHYRTDSTKDEIRLIRDPGYGRFQFADLPNAELRLITIHIVYNKPDEGNIAKKLDIGSYSMRRNEFNVIAKNIYTRISEDHSDINCSVAYTIILGDYNLNLLKSGAGSPYVPNLVVLDRNGNIVPTQEIISKGFYRIYTDQVDLTTISKDSNNYSNNYDHFTFDEHTKNSVIHSSPHRLDAVERVGGYELYKEKISDHVPIMLEISLK